ncbi:MAG: RraA family protein [Actinobacteria bacterium]|nr:RraA family protein [Actinomycetota bacterium]
MPVTLTAAQFADLRSIDSASIANAIEHFNVRDQTEGYVGLAIKCLFPHFPPAVGYAVTCKGDSTTHGRRRDAKDQFAVWEALEASPKPAILVIQDAGSNVAKSCHCGDVMCTVIKNLGGIAVLTDGGVRDLKEVEQMGVQYFARGVTVSHGTTYKFEAGEPVVIDGLPIKTGDLLHCDANGVVLIPEAVATKVAAAAREVLADEAKRKAFANQPGFTVAKYRQLLGL